MSLEDRLITFLESRKIPFKRSSRSFISDCVNPKCLKEDHLWIKKQNGQSICFKCGKKWTWKSLVAQIDRCSLSEASRKLFDLGAGDILDQELDLNLFSPEERIEIETKQKSIRLGPDFIWVEHSRAGLDYLIHRKVKQGPLIVAYDLRYHAMMDAIVFPVKRDGLFYGWQARKINPQKDESRLLTAPNFNKSQFLLNYDRAKEFKNVILVEGPFDCIQVDLPNYGAVCSFGKSVSHSQIKLLLESKCENIFLGLDPDASEEIYEILHFFGTKKKLFRILPPNQRKDFGECEQEEVLEAIQKASQMETAINLLDVYFK